MNKKGFTLIELISVIAILSILALVATPMILNVVEGVKDNVLISTATNLIRSAKNKYYEEKLTTSKPVISFEDLDYSGDKIESGKLYMPKEEDIILAIYKDSKCVYNTLDNSDIVIDKNITEEECMNKVPYEINEIVDKLLDEHETYTYMNGRYLKGNPTNNYVWYNGFIWRIMGKNKDGSIRLITEENVSSMPFGSKNATYSNSYVKDWLNNYFYPKLKNTRHIVESEFCVDNDIITDATSSRTTCNSKEISKVGIIQLDEYTLSLEDVTKPKSTYLYISQNYQTSTPAADDKIWYIHYGGGNPTSATGNATAPSGIKAVISIQSSTPVFTGNGTLTTNADTEYVLGQTLEDSNGTLEESSSIGEYVMFDNKLYRIINHEEVNLSNGTKAKAVKMILDDIYTSKSQYGTEFSAIYDLLNGDTLKNWLFPSREDEVLEIVWYRGDFFKEGMDYKDTLSSTVNPFVSKIGLMKVGEVLCAQGLSYKTKKYKNFNTLGNTYWTMTQYSDTNAWVVYHVGNASYWEKVTAEHAVRPVIYLSSNMQIKNGNGTMSNPYEV